MLESADHQGRVVLLTGAAGVIGAATARRFLSGGDKVVLCDLPGPGLDALSEDLARTYAADGQASPILAIPADVTDERSVKDALGQILSQWGRVDILVNNAGIQGRQAPIWELSVGEWRELVDINLTGMFIVAKTIIPRMIEAKSGLIVNMASQRGKDGYPGLTHYVSSKGGVLAFTRSLAKECAPYGLAVHAVCPGPIAGGMGSMAASMTEDQERELAVMLNVPMGRFGRPEEVAELVHIVASGRISFSTGYCWDLSGGKAVS